MSAKNKKTLIAGHIMPQEIDLLERQMAQLERCSKYLLPDDYIEIYFTLNLSPILFGWEKSKLTKEFFIDKFKNSEKHCHWAKKVLFEIIEDNSILGTADQKRNIIREYDGSITDYIFIDSDLYFHETLLAYLISSAKEITNKYYIVVPQTVKLWDYTWDILTHPEFASKPYGFEKTFNPENVLTQTIDTVGLIESPVFKFATGWFNLFSAELWKLVDIPDDIGPYGTEDTYCMWASEIMKKKNYDVQQYILSGQYIAEDYIYKNPYSSEVHFYSMKKQCIENSHNVMPALLKNFDEKLKVNK